MSESVDGLPVLSFSDPNALRAWVASQHESSQGIWVRIFKQAAGVDSVTFEDILDAGLCFGWSESKRMRGDAQAYLQRFTPRRRPGTASERNLKRAKALIAAGLMTPAGLQALRLEDS